MPGGEVRTRLIGYALIILAVLVQIQATIQLGGTAVRVNAADIALAVLAPIILVAFYSNFTRLKEIAGPQLLVLAVAASAVFSFSLFRGYEAISGLSPWAAIKYAGWYILLFYLALGVLIAIVAGPAGRERFALGFAGFQVAVIIAFLVIVYSGQNWFFSEGGRLTGFAGNTNAMSFYFICGFAMALTTLGRTDLPRRREMALFAAAGAILAGILFTRSIAALIAIVSVLTFAAIIRVTTLKRLAQVLALGVSFWMIPQVTAASHAMVINVIQKLFGIVQAGTSANARKDARYDATVLVRMEGYRDAIDMWKEQPVFGAGLGVYLHRQGLEQKPRNLIFQIHSTALWLLGEAGLSGFLVMSCIFVVLFHKVWRLARAPPGEPDSQVWFQSAVLLILIGWGVMSLFHEFMYQRVVWLLVGMALTAPVEPLSFWKRKSSPER